MDTKQSNKDTFFKQDSIDTVGLKDHRIWLIFLLVNLLFSLIFALRPTIGFLMFCSFSALIVAGFKPEWILPLLIFSVIFEDLQFRVLGIAVTLHRILLVLGVTLIFLDRSISGKKIWFKKTVLDIPILLVVSSGFISIMNAQNPMRSFQSLSAHLVAFLSFYYVFDQLVSLRKINKIISVVLVSTFIIAIYGLYQETIFKIYGISANQVFDFFSRHLKLPWHLIENKSLFTIDSFARISSLFRDPNVFGGHLVYLFPLILSVGIYKLRNRMAYGKTLSLAFLIFIVIMLTFSRSAWLGLILSMICLVLLLRQRFIGGAVAFLLVLCFCGLLFIVPVKIFTERVFAVGEPQRDISAFAHYTAYRVGIKAFISHPIIGVGLNNFGEYFDTVSKIWWKQPMKMMPHSLYVSFLAETGILGFLANMILFSAVVVKLLRTINLKFISEYWRFVLIGFLSGFIGILGSQIFYQYYTREFLWPLVAISMATCSLLEKGEQLRLKDKNPR